MELGASPGLCFHNWLGDTPSAKILHAWIALSPSRSASARTSSDCVPGFNHNSSQPFSAISGNSVNKTGGGTYTVTIPGRPGTSLIDLNVLIPSTSGSFGFTGYTV